MVLNFYGLLDQYRLLTYGQLVSCAAAELERPDVRSGVRAALRCLIVDEYQDVNHAQERLIELLTGEGQVELCVVGDDDQAIYQWRGSHVRNVVEFGARYPGVRTFSITENRRSVPSIVTTAAGFARSIPGRLDKEMRPVRAAEPVEIVSWTADTEADECEVIATTIQRLHLEGLPYRDIAALVRVRASYGALLTAFDGHGLPVQPAGRTGLFRRAEALLFGKTYAWLVDCDWSDDSYGQRSKVSDAVLASGYRDVYGLTPLELGTVWRRLTELKARVPADDRPVNLVADLYELLADLGAQAWDADDPIVGARLGTLARCSTILADYESVRRRSRPDPA